MVRSRASGSEDSVATLIRDARDGSQEALGCLLEKYRDYLLVVARSEFDPNLRPKGGPSDLVQETFLEAQRDFHQFHGDDREQVGRWLRGLLRNNLADFVRRHHRAQRRRIGREHSLDAGDAEAWQHYLPADTATPSEQLVAQEQQELLRQAIERLPADYRTVILLRQVQKSPWSEVAKQMDRSIGAAQKLWMRALAQLRQEMAGE